MLEDAAKAASPRPASLFEVCRMRRVADLSTFINKMGNGRGVRPLELIDEIESELGSPCWAG